MKPEHVSTEDVRRCIDGTCKCIERQKIFNLLTTCEHDGGACCDCDALRKAIHAAYELGCGRWKSVSHPPEKEGKYLCCGWGWSTMRVGWFTAANANSQGGKPCFPAYVRAWRELPAYPKGEEDVYHEQTDGG